jgi:UDP-GlcNAc:undecaprenyl-phosphate GlcNAc-1-phosphate transferase
MLAVIFAVTLLVGLLVTPRVVRFAKQRGLYDTPDDGRRVHRVPIPRLGGIAVFVATAVGLTAVFLPGGLWPELAGEQRRFFVGLLLGGGIVFAGGLWDDLRGLSPRAKLVLQVVAALVVFHYGFRIDKLSVGHLAEWQLGAVALPLTVFWIAGVTNAFNLIDGMDGLATGIAIVALGTTLAVALALGNLEVAIVSVALLGALVGFLRYNFNPARIFLGDSGSLFVGFMLAVLSVHGSIKSATAVLALVPLFALAVPLLDTSLAIVRRWLRGTPLSGADARHIHHRLLAIGLTQRRAAIVLYVVALALAGLGVLLAFAPPRLVSAFAVVGGGATLGIFLYGMLRLQYHEFIEAGAALALGVLRVRRVMRDRIHARDVSNVIARATSFEQINAVLDDNASCFDFLAMEVCRESASAGEHVERLVAGHERAWKLDYLVMPRLTATSDPYVLRVWCGEGRNRRPHGAERVARLLAEVIEDRLVALALTASELDLGRIVAVAPIRAGAPQPELARFRVTA